MENKELIYMVTNAGISIGELAPDYNSYLKKYRNAPSGEAIIYELMRNLQIAAQDILQLGGQTVRKTFMGFKQLRDPSTDIDLYAKDMQVMEKLAKYAKDKGYKILYNPAHEYFYMECGGVPVSIAYESIKGVIPYELNTHRVNGVKMLKPAELVSMKLRRKGRDGQFRFRYKDLNDYGNLLIASTMNKYYFDVRQNITFSNTIGAPSVLRITSEMLSNALSKTAKNYINRKEYYEIIELHNKNLSDNI